MFMNKIYFKLATLALLLVSLNGCSMRPGVPGLNTASTRYAKVQKEGVDYKLVRISANTIRSQAPFDYAAFIRAKKVRSKALSALSKNNRSDRYSKRAAKSALPQKTRFQVSRSAVLKFTNNSPFSGTTSQDNKANYLYHIGKKDILNITVWDHPELTIPSEDSAASGHVVDNDGRFYFPYAGKIQAYGKTTGQVRDALEKKLANFITNPQISVRVALFRSQKIYTSGAILKPSTLKVSDVPLTVRDAISQSGG